MNKSRILALSGGALAILLLVIGGTWFWSVGSVAAEKLPAIRVQTVKGTTEFKTGDVWSVVADVQEIHTGNTVKTGADSEAQILWGDQGVTRLDENTELVIAEAPADGSGSESSVIRLKVNAGRVWNRMLKLLDVDSAMEVTTSDVVATVRGTSYGIIKQPTCTEAAVTESAVGVLATGASGEVLLTDDQWGSFGANDCKKPVRKLTKDDAWPAEQKVKDTKFDRDYMGAVRLRFDERAKQAGLAPAFLRSASERLHLTLASKEDRERLATAYAQRQLAFAVMNPANAKTSLANIRGLLPVMGDRAGLLRGELHIATTLLSRSRYPALRDDSAQLALPSALAEPSSLTELRLLRDVIVKNDAIDTRYRELVRIDEGVDDVLAGVSLLDGRTRVVADLMSRLDVIDVELDKLADTRLVSKSRAIRARLMVALGIPDVTVPVEPNPEDKPPIRINEPTLTQPVIKAPTTQPTQSGRVYQSLRLLPSPSAPIGGQTVTLKLFGIKSDGQSDELTAYTSFSLARLSDGSLQGNYLTPVFMGTITVNATYRDSVGSRTVSASVVHSAPKSATALQSVEIRFTGPTTVTCSASVPYKVYAIYASGVSKDVSISSTITVNDPKLLYPGDGKILTFCSGQQATGTVTARYTELGVTKTATASITVTPDVLNTTKPTYRIF
ncbi:FecR family protein [Candidatus Uhrbacteria bacterium]|nr:FecR family protein [Candidatus Uhrbacteria bacterium]